MEPKIPNYESHEESTPLFEVAEHAVDTSVAEIQQHIPDTSKQEATILTGSMFVDKTKRDVEQATHHGLRALEPLELREIVWSDAIPAVLTGIREEKMGIPTGENAIRDLQDGDDEGVTVEAVREMAAVAPSKALQAAEIIDYTAKLFESQKSLMKRVEQYEQTFRQELGVAFAKCLTELSQEERELIDNDKELSNRVDSTIKELTSGGTFVAEEPVDEQEYFGKPEIMNDAKEHHARAERVNGDFQGGLQQIADESGDVHVYAPVKKKSEIARKAARKYGGEVSDVRDAVRSRLIIPGDPTKGDDDRVIEDLQSAGYIIATDKQSGKQIIKKGFFDKNNQAIPTDKWNCYMDTKVTVKLKDPVSGKDVLAEVAIATPEMAAATAVEHKLYEVIRSMDSDIATPVASKFKARLSAVSTQFYLSVSNKLSSRLKSLENDAS